jgi:hypothetical protein
MSYRKEPEDGTEKVVYFSPKRKRTAEQNLLEFIRLCRDESTVLGAGLCWGSFRWRHVCQFTKLGTPRQLNEEKGAQRQLDPAIVDLAKAYVRYEAGIEGFALGRASRSVSAFRILEQMLLNLHGNANPAAIDIVVLDQCAQRIREYYKPDTAYHIGQKLAVVAKFLSKNRLISIDLSSWSNPISPVSNLNRQVGKEAERERLKKMPDVRALDALAEIFAHDFNPRDPAHHKDIYTTSVSAMLLAAPSRGQEVHDLPADLEIELPDQTGAMQYGFRYLAGKGYGADIKWVPEVMVPVAKLAVQRLKEITADARKLALYIEQQFEARKRDPNATLLFYRHPNCPDVGDDEPLTAAQVAQALGLINERAVNKQGLSMLPGTYSLNSLWQWILTKQPSEFPWLDKKKGIKYSEALFCMFAKQLHGTSFTSPLILWAPTLPIYNSDVTTVKDQRSIFRRYGYLDEGGQPLRITSHQLRHYLNTLAQRGNMTSEEIAKWSGRANLKQNRVYNHETEFERVDKAKKALQLSDGSFAVIGIHRSGPPPENDLASVQRVVHWNLTLKPKPVSCSDLDLVPRGANHATLWGTCEHDFLFSPCQKFGDCLNCNEHHCIKSAGADDQERLARIKEVLNEVEREYEGAKSAFDAGYPGAEQWQRSQSQYRERLRQLVRILEDAFVPDGTVVRLSGGNNQTHLHRVLRSTAKQALENNTVPQHVISKMLSLLDAHGTEGGTQSATDGSPELE